jgi:hypothetical protein
MVRDFQQKRAAKLCRSVTLAEIWRDLANGSLPRHKLPEPWCHLSQKNALKNEWDRVPAPVRRAPSNFIYGKGKPVAGGLARSRKKI